MVRERDRTAPPQPLQGPLVEQPTLPGDLEPLVRGVLADERDAWRTLVQAIAPQIAAIARSHRSMRERKLAKLEDDIAEVATCTLERLARDDYKNLRRFVAQRDEGAESAQDFGSWLYGSVDFAIRDHLRKRFGRAPRTGDTARARPSRRDLETLAGRFDDQPLDRAFVSTLGATKRLAVSEIFAYVTANFDPVEVQAMQLFYLEDKSASEIAQVLGLSDERAADKLIRKLNARLRYRFAQEDGTSADSKAAHE